MGRRLRPYDIVEAALDVARSIALILILLAGAALFLYLGANLALQIIVRFL